jgi:diguanylate cyclase (GGDEF)-like protein
MKRHTIPFKSLLETVLPVERLAPADRARITRALEEPDDRTLEALGLEMLERLVSLGHFRLLEEVLHGDEKVRRYRDLTSGNTVAVVLPVTEEDEGIFRVPLPLRDWRGSTSLDQIRILFSLYDKMLTQDTQLLRGPADILRQVLITGRQILRAERVTLWASETGEGEPLLAEISTEPYDEEMARNWVLDQNYLVYLPQLPAQIHPDTGELETEIQSLAMVPVGGSGDPLRGVLHAWSKQPFHFNEDRQGLLSLLSECATDLLRRSQLLENLVFVDAGTQVYNRSYFNLQLDNEIARANREGHSLALAIADIDDFRAVNSRYGYEAGNEALAAVAHVLKTGLRPFDSVARWGGEEFALILTAPVNREDAQAVCERLRRALELSRFTLTGLSGETITTHITISIGGALYPQDGSTAESLWRVANAALVEAKRTGKNRVVFASEPEMETPEETD